jgi:exodeoxyribonuclease VII large subunit
MPNVEQIYTVSRLCRETRLVLEGHFLSLAIEGEISNLSCPASGHIYFTLKDDKAQVQCAMFRTQLRKTGFKPDNGMHVILHARVSLYEARGNFQLIVEQMEPAGEGALRQKFEALKNKLSVEGLYDQAAKKPLPSLAKRVAVITSPTGAAIHDILSVLNNRFPALPVLIYPVSVQGETAKFELVEALKLANQRRDCDVIILARGGGDRCQGHLPIRNTRYQRRRP